MASKRVVTQADKNREKFQLARNSQNEKKEKQIDNLEPEQVVAELKNKGLPVYGTKQERIERLKKANGIYIEPQVINKIPSQAKIPKKRNLLDNIQAIQEKRNERRKKMEEEKIYKEAKKLQNEELGLNVDVDFQLMIEQSKQEAYMEIEHQPSTNVKICVCLRKRPLFQKEAQSGEIDCVHVANPKATIFDCRYKVDGITKYLEPHDFMFDNTFHEDESSESVYEYTIKPLCQFIFEKNGTVTCFAYGQTGSGKTYTMTTLQKMAVQDLFQLSGQYRRPLQFYISFFEIYGGRAYDLLNNRTRLNIMEDKNQNIVVSGLNELPVTSEQNVLDAIEYGNSERTTHSTTSNQDSSRSHAICTISIKDAQSNQHVGKMILVDLAGSERAQDCQSNNRQRRIEGAEINKSLLALKECIRAINCQDTHVPYRGSKLTLILRDSFTSTKDDVRIVMITCISPGNSSAEHTLNSLRYADRLKEIDPRKIQPSKEARMMPTPINQNNLRIQSNFQNRNGQKEQEQNQQIQNPIEIGRDMIKMSMADIQYLHEVQEEQNIISEELLHEKIEAIMEMEDEILSSHVNAIKEDAQMLTEEGELISKVQGEGVVDYDIDDYVKRLNIIVEHKIAVYNSLMNKLENFKKVLNEEENISNTMLLQHKNNQF